jgi:hypothetical protein
MAAGRAHRLAFVFVIGCAHQREHETTIHGGDLDPYIEVAKACAAGAPDLDYAHPTITSSGNGKKLFVFYAPNATAVIDVDSRHCDSFTRE